MRSAATAVLLFLGIVSVAQSDGDSSGNPAPNPVKLDVQTYTLYMYTHPNVKPNEFPSVKIGTTVISQSSCKLNMFWDNSSSLEPYWVYDSTDQELTLVSRNRSDFDYGNLHIDGKVVNTTDRLMTFPAKENAGLGPTHPYQPEWTAPSIFVTLVTMVVVLFSIVICCAVTHSYCVRRRLAIGFKVIMDYCGWKKPKNFIAAKQDTDKPGENLRRRNAQNTAVVTFPGSALHMSSQLARGSSPDGGRDEYAGQALVELHGDHRPSSGNPRSSPELMETLPRDQVKKETQLTTTCVQPACKPSHFSHTFTTSFSNESDN